MTSKAKRTTITIAGIKVEVFQLPNGEYVMSQTQATDAVNKQASSIFNWLQSEQSKALLGEVSAIFNTPAEGFNKPIQAVPIEVVTAYWHRQSTLGNEQAAKLVYACMTETLRRRCDAAFDVTRTEQRYESATAELNVWDKQRSFAKQCQNAFTMFCWHNGYNPSIVHNELTKRVTGMTAEQHRQLALLGNNPNVGLDHVPNALHLAVIAQAKLNLNSYRKGTLDEKLNRAVTEAWQAFIHGVE